MYVKVDERCYEVEIRSIDTTTEGEEETLQLLIPCAKRGVYFPHKLQ